VALLAFVATSSPEPSPPSEPDPTAPVEPELPSDELPASEVLLVNALDGDVVVRLRRLAAAVDVDCTAIFEDPGALLSEALLGDSESWTLPPGEVLGLDATAGRSCEAVRVEGDGFAPRWLVWDPSVSVPNTFEFDGETFGERAAVLSAQGEGVVLEGSPELVFVPGEPARGLEQCAPTTDGQRLAWSDPLPSDGVLMDARWGPDGCGSIVLSTDGEVLQSPWFLCVPEASWPFVPGDSLGVRSSFGTGSESVVLEALDDSGRVQRDLHVVRGSEAPAVPGVGLAFAPREDCGYDVESRCGTVSSVGRVVVSTLDGATIALGAGEVVDDIPVDDEALRGRVAVLASQQRFALDPECALGPDVLGPDMAIVITRSGGGAE